MNISNKAAETVEGLFTPFKYKLDPLAVTSATCIALTNFGGDDARAVYEIYVNNEPRFFTVSTLEYPEEVVAEQQWIDKWTKPKNITFLEKIEAEHLDYYLFELISPFGISFE